MPRGVPWSVEGQHVVGDDGLALHEVYGPGRLQGAEELLGYGPVLLVRWFSERQPVRDRDHVPGVGEPRLPALTDVPADVVVVEVCDDDGVDGGRVHFGHSQ